MDVRRSDPANWPLALVEYLERGVLSFQLTILKVLAGHPDGRASLEEVRHAVSLLVSSGSDWTNRMKRLASLVPELDIFGRSFVMRNESGWQITDTGLRFLTLLEAGVVARRSAVPQTSVVVVAAPQPELAPPRLIGLKKRKPRRNRIDRNRRSAA
jgi:hypothetical protein